MKLPELFLPGAAVASIGGVALALSMAPASVTNAPRAGEVVAIQAGTILPVSREPITGGGTLLVEDGHVVAVGKEIEIPPGARVVDYGPDAVVAPGLVAADSTYGAPRPSER